MSLHAAVDLGASSGSVVLARVEPDDIALDVVHRFANEPVRLPDGLHWDILRLYEIWLKTGSPRAYAILQRLGVAPVAQGARKEH